MLKLCGKCNKEKDTELFSKNSYRKDGLQTHCKECNNSKHRSYYKCNHEKMRQQIQAAGKVRRTSLVEYVVRYLSYHPCVDCGEDDPVVLEFDHVRGDKTHNVSYMVSSNYSIAAVQEEIDKCEVRCANCHRRKTHKDFYVQVSGAIERINGSEVL